MTTPAIDANRRTGRTHRLLTEAVNAAKRGDQVVFICACGEPLMREMAEKIAGAPIRRSGLSSAFTSGTLRIMTMPHPDKLRGIDRLRVIEDHLVVELREWRGGALRMMGFRATAGDDDEPTPEVRDGVASEREPTLAEEGAAFVEVAKQLRELGACEVRAGSFRAVWPVQSAPQPVAVQRIQMGPKRAEPPLERFEGEQLTPEQRVMRQRHRETLDLIRGDT